MGRLAAALLEELAYPRAEHPGQLLDSKCRSVAPKDQHRLFGVGVEPQLSPYYLVAIRRAQLREERALAQDPGAAHAVHLRQGEPARFECAGSGVELVGPRERIAGGPAADLRRRELQRAVAKRQV